MFVINSHRNCLDSSLKYMLHMKGSSRLLWTQNFSISLSVVAVRGTKYVRKSRTQVRFLKFYVNLNLTQRRSYKDLQLHCFGVLCIVLQPLVVALFEVNCRSVLNNNIIYSSSIHVPLIHNTNTCVNYTSHINMNADQRIPISSAIY